MQHNIAPIDLETVTGGRTRDPSPPGEVPAEHGFTKHLGDLFKPLHRPNGPIGDAPPQHRWHDQPDRDRGPE